MAIRPNRLPPATAAAPSSSATRAAASGASSIRWAVPGRAAAKCIRRRERDHARGGVAADEPDRQLAARGGRSAVEAPAHGGLTQLHEPLVDHDGIEALALASLQQQHL